MNLEWTIALLVVILILVIIVASVIVNSSNDSTRDYAVVSTRTTRRIVRGPTGQPGTPGDNGKDGVNGKDGTNGKDGEDGTNGAPGSTGGTGAGGGAGVPGATGATGAAGTGGGGGSGILYFPFSIGESTAIRAPDGYQSIGFGNHSGGNISDLLDPSNQKTAAGNMSSTFAFDTTVTKLVLTMLAYTEHSDPVTAELALWINDPQTGTQLSPWTKSSIATTFDILPGVDPGVFQTVEAIGNETFSQGLNWVVLVSYVGPIIDPPPFPPIAGFLFRISGGMMFTAA